MSRPRRSRELLARALLVLTTVGPIPAAMAQVEAGDEAWSARAGDFRRTGRVSAEAAERALAAYQLALEESPGELELRFKVMEALYFKGYFVVEARPEKRLVFERLAGMAEETVALADLRADGTGSFAEAETGLVRAHFWAAIAWGLWGMSHSYLASGTKGVATRIRDHAQKVIALDEEFADAGGLRLLGRLHTATPKIPLFTGWIDRAEGLSLLERAYRLSDRDPRNALFLAEAILENRPEEKDRATELLREVSSRSPDPGYLVEQSETLAAARRLLSRIEGGP